MVSIVRDNIDEIVKACKKMQLRSLFLFGSAGNETKFTKDSDLDFLYQFKKDEHGLTLSQYEKITGKQIDLVAEEKIKNKYFLERVNNEKIKIYES
jgi:predicted nucleotidyltransferase